MVTLVLGLQCPAPELLQLGREFSLMGRYFLHFERYKNQA
jgi:hypothetical protein